MSRVQTWQGFGMMDEWDEWWREEDEITTEKTKQKKGKDLRRGTKFAKKKKNSPSFEP